jgi:hypothetical protein
MKQTAVEFILDYMSKNQYFIGNDLLDIFEQAKAIERNQFDYVDEDGAFGIRYREQTKTK